MYYYNLHLIPNSKGLSWPESKPGEVYTGSYISICTPWNVWGQVLKDNCKDFDQLQADLKYIQENSIHRARLRVTFDHYSYSKDKDVNSHANVAKYIRFDNVEFFKEPTKFDYAAVEQFGTF